MTTTLRSRILRMAAAGGIIAGAAMLPAYAYAAGDCPNYGGGNCGAESTAVVPTTAVKANTSNEGTLPFTGGDVVGLSLIGIGAVAGGTALVRSGRRKSVGA
jgi:cyanophycinase-like exopeptidase